MKWDLPADHWNGSTVLRLWFRLWSGQSRTLERLDSSLWKRGAGMLSAFQKKFRMEWAEVADMVVWYWLWRVPNARAGIAAPDVRPLYGCKNQWLGWVRTRESSLRQVGLVEACLLEYPEEDSRAWNRPASWRP